MQCAFTVKNKMNQTMGKKSRGGAHLARDGEEERSSWCFPWLGMVSRASGLAPLSHGVAAPPTPRDRRRRGRDPAGVSLGRPDLSAEERFRPATGAAGPGGGNGGGGDLQEKTRERGKMRASSVRDRE